MVPTEPTLSESLSAEPPVTDDVESDLTSVERREGLRSPVRAMAVVDTEDGRTTMLEVVDISSGGMRVRHQDPPMGIAQELHLELELDGKSIKATGRVSNINEAGTGIEFIDLGEDARLALELFVCERGWV